MPGSPDFEGFKARVSDSIDELRQKGRASLRMTPQDFSSVAMGAILDPRKLADIFGIILPERDQKEGTKIRFEEGEGLNIPVAYIGRDDTTGLPMAVAGLENPEFYMTGGLLNNHHVKTDRILFGMTTPPVEKGQLWVAGIWVIPDVTLPFTGLMGLKKNTLQEVLWIKGGCLAINGHIRRHLPPLVAASSSVEIHEQPRFKISADAIAMTLVRR